MAASGINVKMGVSGVSQFKNNMNQAKQAVKTLDSQLALSEKQFKASGDAESYMSEKAELLKAKLEQQKTILSNAEKALQSMADKGVDKASKSYQDMYRQMLAAKGSLIDTQSEMDSLTASCDEASNGISEINSQLSNIGQQVSFETVTKNIDSITSGIEKAAKKALQLGKNIVRGSMDAAAYADDIVTRASKYGKDYDAELVQQMDNVAAYIDTDTDTIINAQKRLRKAMGAEDNKDTMGAFAALGIDPNNTDWQDAFWIAGEALRNLGSDIEREEYATRLFGRSWDELNPLFETGRQKYEQMLSEQTVLTNAQVDALAKEDDAMKKMQQQIDLLKNQFWAGLAPAITDATNALSGLIEEFNKYLQTDEGQEMLERMGQAVSGLFNDISKIEPQKVISGFSGVFNSITEGFKWIYENKQGIITTLEGIAIGWGALKLTGGALKMLELISGIKGLTSVSAAAAGAAAGSSWGSAFAAAVAKAAPWLVGLYTLLNPSATSDATGNNTLTDKDGNLTKEAKESGYTKGENGEVVPGELWSNEKDSTITETKAKTVDLTVEHMGKVLGGAIENTKNSIIEGAGGFYNSFTEGFSENLKNFDKDLRENFISGTMISLGTNSILYWNDINKAMLEAEKAAEEMAAREQAELDEIAARQKSVPTESWEYGDDWSIDEILADMARTAGSDSEATRQANSELNAATTNLNGLPAVIEGAIVSGMSGIKVYIDGYTAGQALGPYLNPGYGGMVMKMTK